MSSPGTTLLSKCRITFRFCCLCSNLSLSRVSLGALRAVQFLSSLLLSLLSSSLYVSPFSLRQLSSLPRLCFMFPHRRFVSNRIFFLSVSRSFSLTIPLRKSDEFSRLCCAFFCFIWMIRRFHNDRDLVIARRNVYFRSMFSVSVRACRAFRGNQFEGEGNIWRSCLTRVIDCGLAPERGSNWLWSVRGSDVISVENSSAVFILPSRFHCPATVYFVLRARESIRE